MCLFYLDEASAGCARVCACAVSRFSHVRFGRAAAASRSEKECFFSKHHVRCLSGLIR
uniref:Uncharacterized protein n=1 Tax=Anopheles dirus TaxID=7168 RepID=A0A182NVU8_9DIPT